MKTYIHTPLHLLLILLCLLQAIGAHSLMAVDENTFSLTINQQQPGGSTVTQLFAGEFIVGEGEHHQKTIALPPHAGYQAVLDPNPTTDTCIITLNGDTSVSYEILETQAGGQSVEALVTYAPVEVSYTVNYYQQNIYDNDYSLAGGASRILHGITGAPVDMATVLDDAHDYDGFTRRPLPFDIDDPPAIAGDGSTVINVYYDRNYYILSFAPNGAIDCPNAMFMRYGTPVDEDNIADPERGGYKFTGWTPAIPTTMPAENVVCTAQWTRESNIGKVRYIIWGECADDESYEYIKSIPAGYDITGQENPTASYTDLSDSQLDFPDKEGYENKHGDTNVPILADGSTVVNIYFDRKEYSLSMYNRNKTSIIYAVTGKWGKNIMDEWIRATDVTGNAKWSPNPNAKPNDDYPWTFLAIYMPIGGGNYYMNNNAGTTITIHYYKQEADGYVEIASMTTDTKEFTLNGPNHPDFEGFRFHHATVQKGQTIKEINDGYKYSPDSDGTTLSFYYNIQNYTLAFSNGGDIVKEYDDVEFETTLSNVGDVKDYVPGHPANIPSSYMFAGWTLDPETLGEPIDLTKYTMPGKNLILYAKWIPPVYNITAYQTSTLQKQVYSDQITWGDSIVDELPDPHGPEMQEGMEGYNFINWFYKDKNGVEYVFDAASMVVKSDLVLYGKWKTDTYVNYEVRFENASGETLATPIQDMALGGSNITLTAKSIPMCFPSVHSTSLFIDLDATKNIYTFIYSKPPNVPYTVRYLDRKGNELHADKVVDPNTKDVVTERFEPIAKYVVDEPFKMLYLVASSDEEPSADENVLVFYYDRNDTQVAVTVDCFVNEDLSGDPANAKYVLVPTLSQAKYVTYNPDETTTYTLQDDEIPAIEHYELGSMKPADRTQALTDVGIAYELYYEPIAFTVTYSTGVDGCEPWQVTRVLEGDSTPSYDGDTSYPIAEQKDDHVFMGFDKEIAVTVTEDATYTAVWDGVFHVYHCTADGSDVPQEDIRISKLDGNAFDVTAKLSDGDGKEIYKGIPEGYLYGGLWSDSSEETLLTYEKDDVSGVELQPEAGDNYFVREISNGYLTPKTLTVKIKGLYYCALVSAIDDPLKYIDYAFDVVEKGSEPDVWTVDAYDTLKVIFTDKSVTTYTPNNVFPGLTGKMLCHDVPLGDGVLTFKPFYVTKDKVKVYSIKKRALTYHAAADSSKVDVDEVLPCEFYGEHKESPLGGSGETMTLPLTVSPAFMLGAQNTVSQVTVTIDVEGQLTTLTVPSGTDCRERISNPSVDGYVFAGWFKDVECTRPASLASVTDDIRIYAGFMADGYLQVAESTVTAGSAVTRLRVMAAVDKALVSSCGFIVSDGHVTSEVQATDFYGSIDGRGAADLFGGVDEFASLISHDIPLANLEDGTEITVTPYWVPLSGTKVTGTPKRIMVNK